MEFLSASNKRIKRIQALQRSSKDRREENVFIAEGIKMYREAPKELLQEVYLTEDALELIGKEGKSGKPEGSGKLGELGKPDVPFYLVEPSVFSKISDTQTPQGILSVLKRPEYGVEEVIKGKVGQARTGGAIGTDVTGVQAGTGEKAFGESKEEIACNPLILVLENLQDPGNLGTILRVGEAAGVTGIIMSKGCVDIFNPKVVRSTMGSIYRMPFVTVPDILETVKMLKGKGIVTYAAHLQGSEVYTDYDYTRGTAFFIGNEGNGLSDEITALADKKLFIPMEGSVESLNAGIAAAVLVYEAHRQRG